MDTLMASGVPVRALPGLDGGYGLCDESEMRPILLTPAEALALSLGASLVAALPQPGLAAAADRGVERLWPVAAQGTALPEVRRRYLALAPALATEPRAIMLTVLNAVIKGRQVVVTPLSGGAAVRLDPFGLTYRHGTWHLLAQAEDSTGPALYPLSAIDEAEPSPRPAVRGPAADGAAEVDPRFSTHVRLRLSGTLARDLRHNVLFRGLSWQLDEADAIVELHVDDPGPILQMAWERADAVEILAPDRWRSLLQVRARTCLERYASAV
jgi:predicted DNA-binding transcriptional regulator YafY